MAREKQLQPDRMASLSSKDKQDSQASEIIKQLKAIIDFSGDGLFVTDGNGVVLLINPAYEKISGYKSHEVEGKNVKDLVDNKYYSRSIVLEVLKEKKAVSAISYVPRVEKELMATGNPVFNKKGEIELVVCSVRDVTYLKQLEWELQNSRALAERLNEEKTVLEESIFISSKMLELIDYAKQVAQFPTSILVQGNTGVGKEVIADFIYQNSDRFKKPYIKVNCSAIPEQLLESELFGYEPGAFTGALKKGKPGLLELADEGTVLLDEIGDMPLGLQAKILRALQEGEIVKIGGVRSTKIDIRVISSSNKDITELVKDKKFREDLFYRLNVVQIIIPDLKERQEDIKPLADYFLNKYCNKFKLQKSFSAEALNCFINYSWPGNIRELKNLTENLVVSVKENIIYTFHLPGYMVQRKNSDETNIFTISNNNSPTNIREKINETEKDIILEALKEKGSIRSAAKLLGVSHSTLSRKIKKQKIKLL